MIELRHNLSETKVGKKTNKHENDERSEGRNETGFEIFFKS